MVESLSGAPILLLTTYRPGYRPPWMERSFATQLPLRPLSSRDSLRVVRSVASAEKLPEALASTIVAKAEGNPLFLEELAREYAEQASGTAALAIPDTVQGVLQARIDRLANAPKRLLQTASVIGRVVPLRLLRAVWETPGSLDVHLLELKRQEFLLRAEHRGRADLHLQACADPGRRVREPAQPGAAGAARGRRPRHRGDAPGSA